MTGNTEIEEINGGANDEAPSETYEDVAREVDTQIETRPAVDKRPQDKCKGEHIATHQPAEEDGDAKRVTGMGGEETILTASIAIYDINEGADDGIVGWTPAGHSGLHDKVVNSTGKEDTESCTAHYDGNALHRVVVSYHQVEQAEIERYPSGCRSEYMNHSVKKK